MNSKALSGTFAVIVGLGLLAMLRIPELRARRIAAVLITLGFAIVARFLRGVTTSGALAGFLVTAILFLAAGPEMFGAVLLVYVLTLAATRFGGRRKRSLGIAEHPSGRDAAQVLANLGCAALVAVFAQSTRWHMALMAGSIAALAEAACDTVSSETGKWLSGTAPRMITSWQAVPAGTDGAISLVGTLLGAAAAGLVGLEAAVTGIVSVPGAALAAGTGFAGMLLDSLLGATLERRGLLTNNAVNLAATSFAALWAILVVVRLS